MPKFLFLIFSQLFFCNSQCFAQIENDCNFDHNRFMSAGEYGENYWACRMVLTTEDSTNRQITATFHVFKDWIPLDSMELELKLDTTTTYSKNIGANNNIEMLRYYSPDQSELFLGFPQFGSLEVLSDLNLEYCTYEFALIVFSQNWRKYQDQVKLFLEI